MMRSYRVPSLATYGRAEQLTLGSAGAEIDYLLVGANFAVTVNAISPTYETNIPYAAACVTPGPGYQPPG